MRAAPSFPLPLFTKAEPALGSQGLQGGTGVSHPESQRTSRLEGESPKRLSVTGILVQPAPTFLVPQSWRQSSQCFVLRVLEE